MAVYFIQAKDGAVKIGRANNVERRMRNLQTAHAYDLTLLRSIKGEASEEWECQHRFRDSRLRGEWFEYHEEMMTFVPTGNSKLALLSEYSKRVEKQYIDTAVTFVRRAIKRSSFKQKDVAQMMGMSASTLSRKLKQSPKDSLKFGLDDFEKYLEVTNDTSPVLYLVEKYLTNRQDDIARLEAEIARLRSQQQLRAAG